jgi:NitT/TauT family transport system substrate-binding protein
MIGRRIALVLMFAMVLSACALPLAQPASVPSQGTPRSPVFLGVGFVPNVQFAPLYVGLEKGYFADEGIELSLEYGFENDYLTLVGTGSYDFMIGSGDQVILGRAQNLPVRYVYNWYTRYPVVLVSKVDAGITEPADMQGKRIGLPGTYGANYVALRGLLEAGGLTEGDIKIESIGFTQAAALSEDKVDAVVDYAVNSPVVLKQSGIETSQIGLDTYLSVPANGLVTNDTVIAQKPALVEAMSRALRKSIDYTLQNPDDAFRISLNVIPEAGGDNEVANRAVFDASLEYWKPLAGRSEGSTSAEDWASAAEFMQRIGLASKVVPAEDLFTNDLLPQ